MSLVIEDGNPWWASPSIRVLDDPSADAEVPHIVAGRQHWVQARVRNVEGPNATNAQVRFYWANPAVGFTRQDAEQIGSSFVSLRAGSEAWVLCLAPWVPSMVNEGHVCLLAEVIPADGPAPNPLSPFAVDGDPRVAQRNVSIVAPKVLPGGGVGFWFLPVEVMNPLPGMDDEPMLITARAGTIEDLRAALPGRDLPKDVTDPAGLGLADGACPSPEQAADAPPERQLGLKPGERALLSVTGHLDRGQVAVVHVTQEFPHRPAHRGGGVTVIVDFRE